MCQCHPHKINLFWYCDYNIVYCISFYCRKTYQEDKVSTDCNRPPAILLDLVASHAVIDECKDISSAVLAGRLFHNTVLDIDFVKLRQRVIDTYLTVPKYEVFQPRPFTLKDTAMFSYPLQNM